MRGHLLPAISFTLAVDHGSLACSLPTQSIKIITASPNIFLGTLKERVSCNNTFAYYYKSTTPAVDAQLTNGRFTFGYRAKKK